MATEWHILEEVIFLQELSYFKMEVFLCLPFASSRCVFFVANYCPISILGTKYNPQATTVYSMAQQPYKTQVKFENIKSAKPKPNYCHIFIE